MPKRSDPLRDSAIQEAFALLRVNLTYTGLSKDVKTLAVTSAIADEGKSTAAAALAYSLSQSGSSVLLVESDLRRGQLATRLGATSPFGLVDVLAGRIPGADAIVSTNIFSDGSTRRVQAAGELAFLACGPRVPNPGDLIESDAMTGFLDWAKSRYDLVIVDTPPVLAAPDTLTLLPRVDGFLVVGRLGTSRRARTRALSHQLAAVGQQPLGLVVFGASKSNATYDYSSAYVESGTALTPEWPSHAEPVVEDRAETDLHEANDGLRSLQ